MPHLPHNACVDQLWAWLEPRLPRFGITRVADVTGLDELGLPVSVAVRPLSRALSVSQGKGLTAAQARVSAAMESIETWHAERICAPLYQGNAEQARADGLNPLDPAAFPHRATQVPPSHVSTAYIEVRRWGRDETAWVPFDCVSTDFCFDDDNPPVWMRSSNGLAGCPARALRGGRPGRAGLGPAGAAALLHRAAGRPCRALAGGRCLQRARLPRRAGAWAEALLARHAGAPRLSLPPALPLDGVDALVRHVEQALQRPLYWLDLMREEIGIPVVRALMPGLRTLGMERRYFCLREEALA